MDSAKYVTTQRIYINIGKKIYKIMSKMCNTIHCTIQYTGDLINNNIHRDAFS